MSESKEIEAKEASKPEEPLTLARKLAKANGDIKAMKKDGTNKGQGFEFITESQIKANVKKAEKDHGFVIIPQKADVLKYYEKKTRTGGTLMFYDIKQEFLITDGHESYTGEMIGTGSDTGDKAINKAVTICYKNFLKQLFNVSDQDDPEAESVEVMTDQWKQQIKQARQIGVNDKAKNFRVRYGARDELLVDIVWLKEHGGKQAESFLSTWCPKSKKNKNAYELIIKQKLVPKQINNQALWDEAKMQEASADAVNKIESTKKNVQK